MWQLHSDSDKKRIYTNSLTSGRCEQDMVKIDREGNKWWGFTNLLTMPFTRNFAASKVTALYLLGFSKTDLTSHITGLKEILNSDDKEKYQKAYALVLDFESKAEQAADTTRQMTSLVCVYHTMNDEPIDSFDESLQVRKMSILKADPDLHDFFLINQIGLIENFTSFLSNLSQTALVPMAEFPVHSQ